MDRRDPFRLPWSLAGLDCSGRVAAAMQVMESHHELRQIELVFQYKALLPQPMIRIPRFAVVNGT